MEKNGDKAVAKQALIKWAEDEGITPADFSKTTGYTYQHSWGLLRGKLYPTQATIGRLLSAYGIAPASLIVAALDDESQPPA